MFLCVPSHLLLFFFFFNDTATTEIYTLSLHDALPISGFAVPQCVIEGLAQMPGHDPVRSEEHTSELQSPCNLVCRLLLEKKKKQIFSLFHCKKKKIKTNTKEEDCHCLLYSYLLLFFFVFSILFFVSFFFFFFFFNDTATTEIYTLSLHDALPI